MALTNNTSAVFESVNMRAVHYGERIFDGVSENDVENGTFGYLDGLATQFDSGSGVIYNFKKGIKKGEPVVVVNNPAWDEDESKRTNQRRDKFINEAGTPFRAFVVKKTDEFGISLAGFTSATQSIVEAFTDYATTPVYVTIDSTTGKLVASTTSTTGAQFEGRIMRKRRIGSSLQTLLRNYGYSYYLYEIKVDTLG